VAEDATLVEFPAYASRLEEVRRALDRYGFAPSSLQVTSMLDEIQTELAPASPRRLKHRPAATIQ
jgi:hypothetical protein